MPSTYDTPFIDFIPEPASVTSIVILPSLYVTTAVGAAVSWVNDIAELLLFPAWSNAYTDDVLLLDTTSVYSVVSPE